MQSLTPEQITEHLASWGLRRFEADEPYFRWQRESFSTEEIRQLTALAEPKNDSVEAEIAFYDFTARRTILPVLYSQRYDYYVALAPLVAERLSPAKAVLDVGCGPGILTSFYAQQHPDMSVVGVDRSSDSVRAAQEHAAALGLANLRVLCGDLAAAAASGPYDLIVASHALLQAEQDPGLPSVDWRTFARPQDPAAQDEFERRTGLGERLETLRRLLSPRGRLLLFEKTRLLARRIPFQRAVARRGFHLIEMPIPLRYGLVEELADDGPLYHCALPTSSDPSLAWEETPDTLAGEEIYRLTGGAVGTVLARLPERATTLRAVWADTDGRALDVEAGLSGRTLAYLSLARDAEFHGALIGPQGGMVEQIAHDLTAIRGVCADAWPVPVEPDAATDLPLYEHHGPVAQIIWQGWPLRRVQASRTFTQPGGRQVYVEWGSLPPFAYLYWANTFDQRQVVVVEADRRRLVEDYYAELTRSGEGDHRTPS